LYSVAIKPRTARGHEIIAAISPADRPDDDDDLGLKAVDGVGVVVGFEVVDTPEPGVAAFVELDTELSLVVVGTVASPAQ